MAELGFKGHEAQTITGMRVPAGTPGAVVGKLYAEAAKVMMLPDVKGRVAELGFNVIVSSPQEFTAQIKYEVAKWGKVIRDAKIEVN